MLDEYKISDKKSIILIIVFSLMVTFYCQYPLLVNKYAVNDDVRQNTYLYLRYFDNELFKNDYITDFYSRWSSWGLNIFYFIIAFFFDPIRVIKIIPFFTCALLSVYMFRIGKLLSNNLVGILSGFLFILVGWGGRYYEFLAAGATKEFGFLFFILFIYYFLKEDLWKTSIFLMLQALFFYPPTLLICLLTCIVEIVHGLIKDRRIEKNRIASMISLSVVILLLFLLKSMGGHLRLMGLGEIVSMPEFYPGGRKALFFPSLYEQLTNAETGFAVFFPVKYLLFLLFLMLLFLKKEVFDIHRKLSYFIISSFILFIIATVMLYRLYGPARYVRYSLPIFLLILVAINLNKLIGKIKKKDMRLIILVFFFIVTIIVFIPGLYSDYSIAPYPCLYNFLQSLPKDIFIAGHPASMDFIPVHARRKVLVNEETSQPMYADFYPVIRKRTYDFFNAYYSDSSKDIYAFCKQYNITHLIVERTHFSKDYLSKGQFYFNPFNDYIKKLIENRKEFALMRVSKSEIIFEDGDILVIEVKKSSFWLQ